jgi:NAD(P)-dependent dehydrogenase (short-subunit alcohol dehydrogenase family)
VSGGRVALVTGGGSGIGRAAALAHARAGARVVIADVDGPGGEESAQEIGRAGGEAVFVSTDVSDGTQVQRAVSLAADRYGSLDWAFNCAGIQGPLVETTDLAEADWAATIAVNLTGVWLCMKHEIRQMLAQGGGAIVNAASNFGLVGAPRMAAYAASKHGVLGLTKVAALEYARRGIRVNAVCPSTIRTPMIDKALAADPETSEAVLAELEAGLPMGRLGTAQEVGAAVVWLCSGDAGFVTGAALAVDGGYVAR